MSGVIPGRHNILVSGLIPDRFLWQRQLHVCYACPISSVCWILFQLRCKCAQYETQQGCRLSLSIDRESYVCKHAQGLLEIMLLTVHSVSHDSGILENPFAQCSMHIACTCHYTTPNAYTRIAVTGVTQQLQWMCSAVIFLLHCQICWQTECWCCS